MDTVRKSISPYEGSSLPEGSVILDITTDRYRFRRGRLMSLTLIDGSFEKTVVNVASEPDEYEALKALPGLLSGYDTIMTYNGNTFDIPFLEKKCALYGLESPFHLYSYRDIFKEFAPLAKAFSLEKRSLSSFTGFILPRDEEASLKDDAEKLLALLAVEPLLSLMNSAPADITASFRDDLILTVSSSERLSPFPFSFSKSAYRADVDAKRLTLTVKCRDGMIPHHYPDYKNYYYLPLEGYAVHRSLAAFISKDRKEKATPETACTYSQVTDSFLHDQSQLSSYTADVFKFFLS